MFTRPFDSAASFAAAGYDSALNLFTAFPVSDVAVSPTDTINPTRFTGFNPQFLNQSSQSGRFTVGSSGQIQIDYLFDGGAYQGELALFNLSGLETLEPGSTAFIQEAARRSLSGSNLGYVLIQDGVEGAKFSGILDDGENLNAGSYLGTKRFALTPGIQFGLMLVPNGTVQQVFDDPGIEGAFHPLFSLANANIGSAVQLGQWSDRGQAASLFAWEDLQVNGTSDRDFNDLVFRLDGAIGGVATLDSLIDPLKDWRGSEVGQQIAASEPFNIELVFGNGFTETQKAIITAATRSVEAMITQGLPDELVNGQWVDDVRFQLSVESLDGSGGIWARTRLERLREGTLLPIESITQVDGADLAELERSGKLFGVIQHELLEGLGLGTLWQQKGLVDGAVGQYIGAHAVEAFHQLGGLTQGVPVQRSSAGGAGLYWQEVLFQDEVMTANLGFQLDGSGKLVAPVSPVTLAALADLGYQVDLSQATGGYALRNGLEGMQLQFPVGDAGSFDSSSSGWAYGGEEESGNDRGQAAIFWRNYATGDNVMWVMDGTTLATEIYLPKVPNLDWVMGAMGDFTGDGKLDILWRNLASGDHHVWQMDGTTVVAILTDLIDRADTQWQIHGTGDFNQDGVLDILWGNEQTGEILVALREGNTSTRYKEVKLPPDPLGGWVLNGVGDFTADGKPDILWRNYTQGIQAIWQMDGTTQGSIQYDYFAPADPQWQVDGLGDIDIDGQPDILWRDYVNGNNVVWLMDGLTRRSMVPLPWVPDLNWQIQGAAVLALPSPKSLVVGSSSNVSTPSVSGTAVPGSMVKLYANGVLVGQGRAGLNGAWQITSTLLADGSYSLTATAMDGLGVVSQLSTPLAITVDTTAPIAPTIRLLPASDTGISPGDQITQDSTPTLSGTAEVGSVVQLYQDGTLMAQPTVDTNGVWQFTSTALGNSSFTFTAKATDAAGNSSLLSTPIAILVDTAAPIAPTIQLLASSDTGVSNSDFITRNYVPTFTGTAEPNATVQVWADGTMRGESQVSRTGQWAFSPDLLVLGNGAHTVYATALDQAGNVSPASEVLTLTLDTLPPATPTVQWVAGSDTGASDSDGITRDSTPQLTGTADPGSLVKLWVNGGLAEQLTAGVDGTWQTTLSTLTHGTYQVTVTATDVAGNVSHPAALQVQVDTIPPQITVTSPLTTEPVTRESRLLGSASDLEPGTVAVQYQWDDQPPIAITVGAIGTFDTLLNLVGIENGAHQLTVITTDAAGNESRTLLDVQVLKAPILTAGLANDSGGTTADGVTNDPTISGVITTTVPMSLWVGLAGSDASEFIDRTDLVGADGRFTLTPAQLESIFQGGLPDGTHTVQVQVRDATGAVEESYAVPFTLDTQAPDLTIDSLVDGVTWENESLSGLVQGTDGETRIVYAFDGEPTGLGRMTLLPLTDGSLSTPLILPQSPGAHTLRVAALDQAGNVSGVSEFTFLVPDNRPLVDDDLWTGGDELLEDPPITPGTPPSSPSEPWDPDSPGGGFWGYIGRGGSWGSWGGSDGGWNPTGFPGFPDGGGDGGGGDPQIPGCEISQTYQERIETILRYGVGAISKDPETIHKKAALKNRQGVLEEVAKLVQANGLYDQMQPVMHGIFYDASTLATKCQSIREGYILAQDVVTDEAAVRLKTFQAELFAATYQTLAQRGKMPDEGRQQELSDILLELGEAYAQLTRTQTGNRPTVPNFLDSLWQAQMLVDNPAQMRQEFQQGMTALNRSLTDVDEPVEALRFLKNLLQAAPKVASLNADLKDANFMQKFVDFGLQYATVTQEGDLDYDQGSYVLNRLWFGDSKQAQVELSTLFDGLDTQAQRLKFLKFGGNVMKLLQTPNFSRAGQNAGLVDTLLSLGSAYLGLNPGSGSQSLNFIENLVQAQTDQDISRVAEQLASQMGNGVYDFVDVNRQFQRERNLLKAAKQVQKSTTQADLKQQFGNPEFIDQLIELGRTYHFPAVFASNRAKDPSTNFWLDTLYWAKNDESKVRKGGKELAAFLKGFDQSAERLKLLRFEQDILGGLFGLSSFVNQVTDKQLSELLGLGRAYALLQPGVPSASDSPLDFFLDTIYRAQNDSDVGRGSNQLVQFFNNFESPAEATRLMAFEKNLLLAAKLVKNPDLKAQSKDPVFIESLVELGKAYADLDPIATGAMSQTSQLFLNTLWQTQNIQKGSGELEELLEGIDNSITALRFVQKSLDAAKQTQSLQEDELRDSNFLSEFITFAVEYSDAPFGDEWNSNLDSFWFGVWNSDSSGSLIGAATDLQNLIESANPDVSESLGEWLLGNSSNAEILYASTSGQQDPCLDLLGTIRALVAKLIERSDELIADPYDLQFDNWSKANPKVVRLPDGRERNLGSIEGHQEQFRNRQKQLRDLLKKWDEDECRNKTGIKISKSDRDWAFKAAPKPKPKPKPSESQGFQMPDWAVALGVIVVGGAIVIGAALTLPVWAVAALTFLAATTGLQLIDQRS